MSALTGPSSKGEKGKSKYQSLDINSIYNSSRSEASEAQTTKNTLPRKYGMQQLGKVPQRRPPANLPSLKSENSGNDPSISLVPSGGQGWVVKTGESQQLAPVGGSGSNTTSPNPQPPVAVTNSNVTPAPAPAVGAQPAPTQPSGPPQSHSQTSSHSHDKTWSSITGGSQGASLGVEHGPSFLAHQSPQFRQEFPSLSGEPGGGQAHPTPSYGPGPSLRPQTDPASWSQGTNAKPQTQTNHNIPTLLKSVVPPFLLNQSPGFIFPEGMQKKSRSQASHNENRMNNRMSGNSNAPRPLLNSNNQSGNNAGDGEDFIHSRPIIRVEELVKMDELASDPSWAANDDIDYNEQVLFSDGESIGEDEKEKENKLREKSKHPNALSHSHTQQHQQSIRDYEKKEEIEKSNRDKPFMSERDRNQQAWRVGNNTYSDFRNAPPRQLIPQGGRHDDDEMWKEKRRLTNEHKMMAAEKAKQRKEEEEKRYEESRAKKNNKDMSDFHSSISSISDWDKDERTKSSEHFRHMSQFSLEPRSSMNQNRNNRGDRDSRDQYNPKTQPKPPRFRNKDAGKMPQYSSGGGVLEKNWSNHNSFGRRGGPDESRDKDDEYRRDRHDRPSPSDPPPDRFRLNMRDDRSMDSNKRSYYDNSHMDYNQSSFQSNRDRDSDKDKDLNKDFDYRMNDKESLSRDLDKEWESPKGDESRSYDDRMRRDNKTSNDNYSKQSNDHFEEKDNEWRERPQRPESRDRPERLDSRDRHDRDNRADRVEMRLEMRDARNDSRLERQESRDSNRLDSRFETKDFRSLENRQDHSRHDRNNRSDNLDAKINRDRFDLRSESVDTTHSDLRDRPRSDSRDNNRLSRNSKDMSDKALMDGDHSITDSYLSKLTYKDKDPRRDPIARSRDHMHVPGPTPQEKLIAYEHKHNQSQLEKSDSQEKDNDDKKLKKLNELEPVSQVWGEVRDDKSSLQESTSKPLESFSTRNDNTSDDTKLQNKNDDMDKRKRDDKSGAGGRGNRNNRGGPRSGGYSSGSKYSYSSDRPNWQNKDNRQRQGSSRGQKHWNRSESEGSGDEVSPESIKDDKKTDNRKQDCPPKFGTWKDNKDKREDKKDMKISGNDNDKERSKGDKKSGGGLNEGGRKGDGGGFAPRGEPSRRGRGGGVMRGGQSRLGPALYGPPESKPFSSSSGGPSQSHQSSMSVDSQEKSSQQSGQSNKGRDGDKGPRNKGPSGSIRSQDENWETTSETSDGSDAKKASKNRNKPDKKPRGTIGDKRNMANSGSVHINGRPDSKSDDTSDKKSNKDESENTAYSNNGFQEVKSKKNGREGRGGPGSGNNTGSAQGSSGPKEETKRSHSKGNKEKSQGGGVKSQQKSYTREFVCNKPPRMQRLDNNRKLQQQQVSSSQDVSDMNKINQSVSPLFPLTRNASNNEVTSNSCPPPPPTHNAWNKPINASLRTTPPLSSTLTQLTAAPAQITTDKTNIEELGQAGNTVAASSPISDKTITKLSREVDKSMIEGPLVNTIIFENTNFKRDPVDMGMKQRYPIKQPPRTSLDKSRDLKIEDELSEPNHSMGSIGGFKSASELQVSQEGKPQDNMQVPISFGKNEDNADMKLDFTFDTDLSQLSDDKNNQSMHVGQSSAADLNLIIASVKNFWDSPPGSMTGHVDEGATSSFNQGFTSDKSVDPTAPSHHNDHSDFNAADSVYGSAQLSSSGAYVTAGSSMMKPDTIVSNANTMCKTNMFQVSPQPQQVTVMPHPGPLSTPPPLTNVLSFQGYSNNLSAVPSPPNVVYNSQQAGGPQTEIYQTYSLGGAPMHGSGNRSYADFPQSFSIPQNSTFQPSMYMPSAPSPQSVFQSPNQFRIPPLQHSSTALSQQINSNPSTMLMSSSSSSVVSGNQVKSTQGSMQATAIGSKSGGGPPTAAYGPSSPQILLIEPQQVGFLHQSYHRTATIPSSSYFATNSLTPGASSGGMFSSPPLLNSGGTGASTGNLASAGPFGVQPPTSSYNQQQPPSSTQPPTHHQQSPYSNQCQMAGSFRNQSGYAKAGQHPSETAKSSSNDQIKSMFFSSVQGSSKPNRLVGGKPQPSASPQPQQKFTYNPNPQSVSQSNLGYQQNSSSNGSSRQQQVMRGNGSVGQVVGPSQGHSQVRHITPIQRPLYSQQQVQQQQQAAILQHSKIAACQQQRLQQSQHQPRSVPPPQQPPKQYYQQQGGGMKLEGNESVKNEVDETGKTSHDKSSKDDSNSEQ